jgi:flavin reductase (DIM6/NTAB) family NADH-FMN oxidoreductase RutF
MKSEPSITVDEFKEAMSRWPSGVSLVTTTKPDGSPVGVIISSFTSASLDPPLISFYLGAHSQKRADFEHAEHFAVTILPIEEEALARNFTTPHIDPWHDIAWRPHPLHGCPLVAHAEAHLIVTRDRAITIGDHILFVGRVIETRIAPDHFDPLVYYHRTYRRLAK